MHAELVEKLQPARRGSFRIFARHARAAVPAVQRRKIRIGLETGRAGISAAEIIVQFAVFLQHVTVGIDDRIVHVHGKVPSTQLGNGLE